MFAHHGVAALLLIKKWVRKQSIFAIRSWGNGPMEFCVIVTEVLNSFTLVVAALSNLILMLNEEHSGYNKWKRRTAVLCSLFVGDNGPINALILIFAYNRQTAFILFAHGVAVTIHCNLQQSNVSFAQEQAASFFYNSLRKAVPFCSWGSSPVNFRLPKELSYSRSFAEHKMRAASVYA